MLKFVGFDLDGPLGVCYRRDRPPVGAGVYNAQATVKKRFRSIEIHAQKIRIEMSERTTKSISSSLVALLVLIAAGCTDGPFYHMKRMNPYFMSEWKKDRELGPVFEDRIAELELLKSKLPRMDAAEQDRWAQQIEQLVLNDPSPELRSQAALCLSQISSPAAIRALNAASADEVEKVRLMACKAWEQRGGNEARDMLMSLATKSDETTSVRKAAVNALASFDEPEVRSTLTNLIDDPSPAIQFQVADSLKTITGRDYGGDFESWKQFMAGQDVPEPQTKSMTARMWDALPSWR